MNEPSPRDTTAFEVREALLEPGCAVCRLALRSVARLIQSIAYEQVNDIALRKDLRRARGFCNAHAHQWLRESRSVLGTALIYRDVLHAALRDLDPSGPRGGGLLRGFLSPPRRVHRGGSCPACLAQREAEARYVEALLAVASADPSVIEASAGVCRRHALAALRLGGAGADLVVDHTRKVVEVLVSELDEVIRKEDYRFRDEPRTDADRTAPPRAINWAAGAEGVKED
jgi:hypothetical protein